MSLTVGSLFAGIGGFDLGLTRAGCTVRWQLELDLFCNRVLERRFPGIPRYGDIRTVDWGVVEPVDLICGGFPCQPFSLAGQRRGTDDDRYLWPAMLRGIERLQPTWVIAENVPGLVGPALDQVLSDLEAAGYETGTLAVPACAVDAPHIRQRLWIVAHAERAERRTHDSPCHDHRQNGDAQREESSGRTRSNGEDVADAHTERRHGRTGMQWERWRGEFENGGRWPTESGILRVAHGIPARVDRLRGLGNAIVPQIAEWLGRHILAVDAQEKERLNS